MTEIIWQAAKVAAAFALVGLIIAFGVGMSWVAAEMEREEMRRRRRGRRR